MSKNNINSKGSIKSLESKFEMFRVYGDERDLEIFRVKKNPDSPNCEVYIRAPYLYPELKDDPKNKILVSPECLEASLVELVKYKFRNWTKVVLYPRIEDRESDEGDLTNSCAVPLSTYTELLNARRTNPAKAKEYALRIVRNTQIINDYKFGKISEQEFRDHMIKAREEYAREKNKSRSLVQFKKDN